MPDLLTHLLLGIALALVLRPKSREEGVLIVLGGMIIDFERPFTLLVETIGLYSLSLGSPFHSLLGAVCLSLVASSCFEDSEIDYWKRFNLIFVGSLWHLLTDMTLYPWEELGLFLLYPLKLTFSFNLFWPGFIGYPLIGVIACLIAGGWYWFTERHFPRDNKI